MPLEYILLGVGTFFGALTNKVCFSAYRTGTEITNLFTLVVVFLAGVSMLALLIWGFINLDWWVPLASYILLAVAIGHVVTEYNFEFFFRAMPITGAITISVTVWAWSQ